MDYWKKELTEYPTTLLFAMFTVALVGPVPLLAYTNLKESTFFSILPYLISAFVVVLLMTIYNLKKEKEKKKSEGAQRVARRIILVFGIVLAVGLLVVSIYPSIPWLIRLKAVVVLFATVPIITAARRIQN